MITVPEEHEYEGRDEFLVTRTCSWCGGSCGVALAGSPTDAEALARNAAHQTSCLVCSHLPVLAPREVVAEVYERRY